MVLGKFARKYTQKQTDPHLMKEGKSKSQFKFLNPCNKAMHYFCSPLQSNPLKQLQNFPFHNAESVHAS